MMFRKTVFWLLGLIGLNLQAQVFEEFSFYGHQQGYDEEVLKEHLMLSRKRQILDLAGDWTVTIEGQTKTVRVPSCYDYYGTAVFKRTFIPGEEFRNKHFKLVAFGINYFSTIRINNEFIINVLHGYAPVEEDLSESLIRIGEPNTIEITVDSRVCGRPSIPTVTSILQPKPYGGILREIFLLATPKTAIEKYAVDYAVSHDLKKCEFVVQMGFRDYSYQYNLRDTARFGKHGDDKRPIRYLIELYNEDDPDPVYTNKYKKYRTVWETPKVKELNEDNVLLMGNMSAVETRFQIDKPIFWNPGSAYRYRMVLSLIAGDTLADQVQFMIGILKREISDKKIVINSQSVNLNGVVYYEDRFGFGGALNYAGMEQDIIKIRELGANAIYFANHPPHPYFVDLCDRYGFLLLYPFPLNYIPPAVAGVKGFVEDTKNYVRAITARNRTHPSILAWGIAASTDFSNEEIRELYQSLLQALKSTDRRPVFAVSVFGSSNDAVLENADIVVLNMQNNDFASINNFLQKNSFKNPVPLLIYGSHIFSNNQNGYSDPSSVKYQAKLIIDIFKRLQELKLAGGFIHSFNDFTVNRSYTYSNPNADRSVYTSGLLTDKRKERLAFQITKALFTGDKYDPLPVGSLEIVYPKTYPIVGLILVVIFVVFYRRSEKFGGQVFRSITKLNNFFDDVRENRVITIWPALLTGLLSSVALATMMSVVAFELRRNQIFDELTAVYFIIPSLKKWIDGLVWQPEIFVLMISLVLMIKWILLTLLIYLFNLAFRAGLSYPQSFIAGFWSTSHYMVLIPFMIILQRLMSVSFCMFLGITLIGATVLWHGVRLLKIFKIVYNTNWYRVSLVFGSLLMFLIIILAGYWQSEYYAFDVLSYIRQLYHSGNYLIR